MRSSAAINGRVRFTTTKTETVTWSAWSANRQRCGLRLFACVLKSNQVPFHLETTSVPLSEIMRGIQFR